MPVNLQRKSFNYWWRLFATGFSYCLFAVGGGLLAPCLALLLLMVPIKSRSKRNITRWIISASCRQYMLLLKALGLLTYEIKGLQNIRSQGQIIIANHPTLLDGVFLVSIVPSACCIVRKKLWNNPFTAVPVRAAGYINNAGERVLEQAALSLKDGSNLVLFPEGTRTKANQLIKFQRGAASVALMANVNPTPVLINCSPPALQKKQSWYNIPDSPPHYQIDIFSEVLIEKVIKQNLIRPRAARILTRHLEELFAGEIGAGIS
ncbi:MAG: 1-acyl-sn-glycerol-3-phosphate acyltransferase [Gammaproteobacteria bacterium]|nr:1-acyl-sn-glycerol-3-phosphate acyltransferase [Gammaproteobacteria bacterium]